MYGTLHESGVSLAFIMVRLHEYMNEDGSTHEPKGAPMALTDDEVRGIAEYASIALNEEELASMTAYLNDAVSMLEPILSYTAEDVDPTFHPIGDLSNVMRADAFDGSRALSVDEALSNAGASRDGQFRVPSILGRGDR